MNVCPADAIYVDDSTGAKIINYNKCIGCKMCMIACPFGAISVDPLAQQLMKCDLCSGEPACVTFCPTGAIEYINAYAYDLKRQRKRITEMKRILRGGT
jgi:Fe-S-cluster-containing hydrogenase component 2